MCFMYILYVSLASLIFFFISFFTRHSFGCGPKHELQRATQLADQLMATMAMLKS